MNHQEIYRRFTSDEIAVGEIVNFLMQTVQASGLCIYIHPTKN